MLVALVVKILSLIVNSGRETTLYTIAKRFFHALSDVRVLGYHRPSNVRLSGSFSGAHAAAQNVKANDGVRLRK